MIVLAITIMRLYRVSAHWHRSFALVGAYHWRRHSPELVPHNYISVASWGEFR